MSVLARTQRLQKPSLLLGVTGTAPQTVADGVAQHFVLMDNVDTGTLSVSVTAQATTSTLTISGKWQVSGPGTPVWVDCASQPNAPANVVLVTGTGSAVTTTLCIPAPTSVYGQKFARYVFVSGVTTGGGTGGGDQVTILGYNYRLPSPFNS
jgi:hypothetical protein